MEKSKLEELETRISAATGEDRDLDRLIRDTLAGGGEPAPRYSSSVDDCIALIGAILPKWAWHTGFGPRGIMPYASLRLRTAKDGSDSRVETTAPTVPLALLHAAVKALLSDR